MRRPSTEIVTFAAVLLSAVAIVISVIAIQRPAKLQVTVPLFEGQVDVPTPDQFRAQTEALRVENDQKERELAELNKQIQEMDEARKKREAAEAKAKTE